MASFLTSFQILNPISIRKYNKRYITIYAYSARNSIFFHGGLGALTLKNLEWEGYTEIRWPEHVYLYVGGSKRFGAFSGPDLKDKGLYIFCFNASMFHIKVLINLINFNMLPTYSSFYFANFKMLNKYISHLKAYSFYVSIDS